MNLRKILNLKLVLSMSCCLVSTTIINDFALAQDAPAVTNPTDEFVEAPEDGTPKIESTTSAWQKPNYEDQKQALGWTSEAFAVPANMKNRVDFWVDIYTKYNTQQGLIHDAFYLDIIYESVDFTDIRKNQNLSARQQRKAIEKLIKDKKAVIRERLLRLSKLTQAEGLQGEDLRIWNLFARLKDKNKFIDAADSSRLRFQLGQSDRFLQGIFYSGRYLRKMEAIFKEESLPIELTRLPFVESSFNIFARSKVGASGVWQFMRRSAKPYMRVNNLVDERNEPLRAARGAARMLRSNFQFLGSWPLAITGWNHGPNGVLRIVRQMGTKDISTIVNTYTSRSFGFASENFYACFLAALQVEANATKYFQNPIWSQELKSEDVKVTRSIPYSTLKIIFGRDEDLTSLLNPQFSKTVRTGKAPIPTGVSIRVPVEKEALVESFFANPKMSLEQLHKSLTEDKTSQLIAQTLSEPKLAVVKLAENNSKDSKVAEIKANETKLNQDNPNEVKTDLPKSSTTNPVEGVVVKPEADNSKYKVKRGENLTMISRRLGISLTDLMLANPKKKSGKIQAGETLNLPQSENKISP